MKYNEVKTMLEGKVGKGGKLHLSPNEYSDIEEVTSFFDSEIGCHYSGMAKGPVRALRRALILNGYRKIEDVPSCPICNESLAKFDVDSKAFTLSCSTECAAERRRITTLDMYGVENVNQLGEVKQKAKNTNLRKYGVESVLQLKENRVLNSEAVRSDKVKEKRRKTNLEKYGSEWATQNEDVAEKIKLTNLERYGVENSLQNAEVQRKRQETLIELYGTIHPLQNRDIMDKARTTCAKRYGSPNLSQYAMSVEAISVLNDPVELKQLYNKFGAETLSTRLGIAQSTIYLHLHKHGIEFNPTHGKSSAEMGIISWLEDHGIEVEQSNRTILDGGRELDIYIPSHDVAIEYNGIYWHSERFKERTYHRDKSLECKDKGIQLIHVWEDDWKCKQNIVKSKILSKLGMSGEKVYARQTHIEIIESKEASDFMDMNHIQGKTVASIWIGLRMSNGELVACLGMKRDRREGVWDLSRYATSKTVVGGFSKLLKHFKNNFEWNEIFTYAHLDYSHGGVYEKNGFTKTRMTVPGMWYTKGDKRFRREMFMKHKLKAMFENFDPTKTEHQIMNENGYYRIYDAGSIKYAMVKEE